MSNTLLLATVQWHFLQMSNKGHILLIYIKRIKVNHRNEKFVKNHSYFLWLVSYIKAD